MGITSVEPKVNKLGITVKGDWVEATPSDLEVWKGETLKISSTAGKFRVVFRPWPFKEAEQVRGVRNNHGALTFDRSGEFEVLCYLTPTGSAQELAYGAGGGAHGIVRP